MTYRKILPFGLVILGLFLVGGAFYLLMGNNTLNATPDIESDNPQAQVDRVTLNDAKEAYDTGSGVFLDVRDTESYSQSHIPGAISIPLGELGGRSGELEPDKWYITYCT
jgi:hypothetical protein